MGSSIAQLSQAIKNVYFSGLFSVFTCYYLSHEMLFGQYFAIGNTSLNNWNDVSFFPSVKSKWQHTPKWSLQGKSDFCEVVPFISFTLTIKLYHIQLYQWQIAHIVHIIFWGSSRQQIQSRLERVYSRTCCSNTSNRSQVYTLNAHVYTHSATPCHTDFHVYTYYNYTIFPKMTLHAVCVYQ